MFRDWCEYRDFLLEKLVKPDPAWTADLVHLSRKWDRLLEPVPYENQRAASVIVQSIHCNDYTGTKPENHRVSFIEKYRHDRAASLPFVDGRCPRETDELTFAWFAKQIKVIGKDEDGRRVSRLPQLGLNRHKYWIEGDVLCRMVSYFSPIR